MKNLLLIYTLLSSCLLVLSCQSSPTVKINNGEIEQSSNLQACNLSEVSITADFPAGRMDKCHSLGNNEFLITLIPENTPINSSPWYAFKIEAKQPTNIQIKMLVQGYKHRYLPKISQDGKTWQSQPHQIVGEQLIMNIAASSKPVYISAQEIINNQYYIDWAKSLLTDNTITHSILGNSTQGRPIYQLEHKTASNEWVVILGRMHPPEITGALALFPFTQQLLFNSKQGEAFRKRFNILLIPNLNPDGVEHGHWRSNINGVDLNRDWKNFKQQETQLIRNKLEEIVSNGGKIVFAIDFHSTKKDIFYTMPTDYGLSPAKLVENWLNALDDITPEFKVVMKPGNNPNNGVFKQYIADKYGVHAITYEVADEADRSQIRSIAQIAALTFMQELLNTPKQNFYKNKPSKKDK